MSRQQQILAATARLLGTSGVSIAEIQRLYAESSRLFFDSIRNGTYGDYNHIRCEHHQDGERRDRDLYNLFSGNVILDIKATKSIAHRNHGSIIALFGLLGYGSFVLGNACMLDNSVVCLAGPFAVAPLGFYACSLTFGLANCFYSYKWFTAIRKLNEYMRFIEVSRQVSEMGLVDDAYQPLPSRML